MNKETLLNPKRRFVLYTEFMILATGLVGWGFVLSVQAGIHSLFFLGVALGMLGQVFSIRVQSDASRWRMLVFICPFPFLLVAASIVLDASSSHAIHQNVNGFWFANLCGVGLVTLIWSVVREYRAMKQSMDESRQTL